MASASDVFIRFARLLHREKLERYPTFQDWIEVTVRRELTHGERLDLADFLAKLLDGTYSEPELQDIYEAADAEYHFEPIKPALQIMHDILI